MPHPDLSTAYTLARSSKDYREVNEFLSERNIKSAGLGFPTIIARRKEEVVGVAGNVRAQKRITMGLYTDVGEGNKSFVSMRLSSCYDGVLRKAGVTKYWVHVSIENEKLIHFCRKMPIYKEVKMNGATSSVWFERAL